MIATQTDMFEGESAPVADLVPAAVLDELTAVERSYRTRLIDEGGTLARVMRTAEQTTLPCAQLVELWRWVMSIRIGHGLAANTTVARYAEIATRYLRWCIEHNLEYRTMSAKDIDTWQKSLAMERRNGVAWRKLQLQALRSLYDWRRRMGLGPDCTAGIKAPRKSTVTARKYSRKQLRQMFGAIDERAYSALLAQRDRTLLLFLLATGARRDEAGGLVLEQIELGPKTGVVRFWGKGSKERNVGFEGPIVDALRDWILLRDQHPGISDAVFWSTDHGHGNYGQRLCGTAIERIVSRYAKAAGMGAWGVHRFRVTYATQLYDAGTDIERVRIALGHESIETTRRYLNVSERQIDTRLPAANQWDALGQPPKGLPRWAQAKESPRTIGSAQ